MKTLRMQESLPPRKSLIDAKDQFLQDLQKALAKENTIAGHISRIERVPKPAVADSPEVRVRFGLVQSFIRRVHDKRVHEKNAEKLQTLIEHTRRELAALRAPRVAKVTTRDTLTIHYRNGVVKPTARVGTPSRYHWEMQSGAQAWSQIGATGDTDIRPGLVDGEVRLSYDRGALLSNRVKLSTVIKRQAAAAKRKQYRFRVGEPAFEQRCRGVAGRIQRLLKPPRHLVDADFQTRVFQDRVAQLPEHLNLSVLEVIDLCETGTTADSEYVHMIEFVEPTVYLNPRKLHAELRDIYDGKRLALRLPTGAEPEPEETKAHEDDNVVEQAQRAGREERERRRLDREQKRLDAQEREQRKKRVEEDQRRRDAEQAAAADKAQQEKERIEREQADAAEEARQEKERIEREQAAAIKQAQIEEAQRKEELRIAEERHAEDIARLEREKQLASERQRTASRNMMRVFGTKAEGVEELGADAWFMTVLGNIYTMSGTGGSATLVKNDTEGTAEEKANAAQWFKDPDALRLAQEAKKAKTELKRERERLEKEAAAADAAAAAEQARLEQEAADAAAAAAAEQARLEQEAADAAAAEQARLEQEAADAAAAERQSKIQALREDPEQLAFIKYVFTTYDKNGNNKIDELEMVQAYMGTTRVVAGAGAKVIRENDQDGDGRIDLDEFIDWCAVSGVMANEQWKQAAAEFKASLVDQAGESKQETVHEFGNKTIQYALKNKKVRVGDLFRVKGKTYRKRNSKGGYDRVADAPPSGGNNLMLVSAQQPPGELSAMIDNMTDDWVSSDEELNFAEQSENDSMEFAASSSLDTDSDLDFAQSSERSVQANSSEEESHSKTSSGMEFAESSAAETDSDLEFAESSDKTSSGLEFAESSAVESD